MDKKNETEREYQGVRDEIRQQHLKMKEMSLKGKITYFLDYYKFHTIIVIIAIAVIAGFVHDIVSSKDYCFNAMMLNVGSNQISSTGLSDSFSDYADFDTEKYQCYIDTSSTFSLHASSQFDMVTSQKIFAMRETGELDCFVIDSEVFNHYAISELFTDMQSCFTPEELDKYKDYLYYIDYAEVEKASEAVDNKELYESSQNASALTFDELIQEAERHRHPEEMEQPVLVGIFISDSPFIKETNAYPEAIPVFGIVNTSQRIDTCKKYLDYLFDESVDFSQLMGQGFY